MSKPVSEKVGDFFGKFTYKTYKKGEILIRADENPSGIFYLTAGSVKQYVFSRNGEEVVLNIFKPRSFFPMSWAFNQTPNVYFFEALTNAELWLAPHQETVEYVKHNPDVLYDLLQRVYKGTDGMLQRMVYLMSGNAYARLITELLIYAKRFGKNQEMVEIGISEKDLAAQSGMTRETVSREMKKLKNKHFVVEENNKLAIRTIRTLEEELSSVS